MKTHMKAQATENARIAPIFLSTDFLEERHRFDAWREEFALAIAQIDVDTSDKSRFHTAIHALRLPGIAVSKTSVGAPVSLTRTRSLLRDDDDAFVFIMCLDGEGELRFGDDRACLSLNTGTLAPTNRLGGWFSAAPVTTCSLRISREVARTFAPAVDEALLCQARPGDPSVLILRAYVEALLATPDGLSPAMAALADVQLRELLAHIINPAGDLARSGAYGGIKAARLRAVLDDVGQHIADSGLSADQVGRRLGLSGRYVQQLLEGAGYSFSAYVRELRLESARRMLRDPRLAEKRISDICWMAGFTDLSHFNRAFRAHFGQTPKDVRHS